MSIGDAARATRIYHPALLNCVWWAERTDTHTFALSSFDAEAAAQAACDRLNLAAVLDALRGVLSDALQMAAMVDDGTSEAAGERIDALLAELKETTGA
jgi:hypothetical protein